MNGEAKLSEIMLTLLLISMLTLAFNVQQVETPGTVDGGVCTVCIRADGSVDPPTAPIQRDGDIYTLTGNVVCDVYSDGIVIERNDMILDGAGYTVQGISDPVVRGTTALSGRGITLSGRRNVTIRNITVEMFAWGIAIIKESSENSIVASRIRNNGDMGIWLDGSSNNRIVVNNITNNPTGIHVDAGASNNFIYHNNFINNTFMGMTRQVSITTPIRANFWDDGYPSGGNYWSNYNGTDLYINPNQDQPGSDGIGDTPYVIDAYNRDRYPLMDPWGTSSPSSYTLTVYSSPTGVPFTVDDVSCTTPWSGTYSEGASVSLVMPSTHAVGLAKYYWIQWSDGVTSRLRTAAMNTNITLTAHYSSPFTQLYVDPPRVEYWTPAYDKTFNINVALRNVIGLYGYEFKLYWNTTLLDCVGVNATPPAEWDSGYFIAKNETDETLGRHWLAATLLPPAQPFTGNATLVTLTFKITYDAIYPENVTSLLELTDTYLSDENAEAISHVAVDGEYWLYSTKPISGDVNSDGIVNLIDLRIVARAFGSKSGDPNWDLRADLKCDGIINVFDLVLVSRNYGRTKL